MRNLLYLILFYCIYQSSTLDNDLEYFLETLDEEMDVKPLHQAQMPNPKMGNDNTCGGNNVSFDAERTSYKHVIGTNVTIIFDKLNLNTTKDYNPTTGIFICQVPGIYFFSFSSLPKRGVPTDVVLMKNETKISNIHSVLSAGTSQLAVKNAILKLEKFESVWVRLERGGLWSRDGSISFQGFLIYG
ncbi:complement C1q tumor necrosis factor-related protein 4-like [Leucoraja erinacea]|uniref:complement C1q tumor necrosis factor-related protein 4-like n=1 Tax=Leucoraja erinaceus TaxID=7782 RepID=UPI002457E995|nr:complement C1q tumor necrosis factor-related protein 4-like [Leucoraja erinacea]